MHDYSSEELDLMADAYERACEELSRMLPDRSTDTEAARSRLIDGIVEAMDRGERSVESLVAASLSTISDLRDETAETNWIATGRYAPDSGRARVAAMFGSSGQGFGPARPSRPRDHQGNKL